MVDQVTSNYGDRYLDLLIMQGFNPLNPGGSDVSLSLGDGSVCAGVQKVIQEFVILLLTGKGTNTWDAERGTDFIPTLSRGLIQDENILQAVFKLAVSDILDYMEDKIGNDTPDDEILTDAVLESWDLQPGTLKIKVRITTLAGDSSSYVIPVSF